jgi:transposase
MDNLATHKVDGIEEAIKSARATLRYLPKWSPDLNPYRVALQQIQSVAAGGCRADRSESLQGDSLFRSTAQECADYPRYAGCAFV